LFDKGKEGYGFAVLRERDTDYIMVKDLAGTAGKGTCPAGR